MVVNRIHTYKLHSNFSMPGKSSKPKKKLYFKRTGKHYVFFFIYRMSSLSPKKVPLFIYLELNYLEFTTY